MALLRELEFGRNLEGTTLPPPRVYDHRVSKAAMDRFLVFLTGCNNPDTNKRYTVSELTKIYAASEHPEFRYSPDTIKKKLRAGGIYYQPMPRVRQDELPENERSFFLGLALGGFQIEEAHWGDKAFIVLETESKKNYRRELLRQTIGTWGDTHDNAMNVRVYVDSPKFDFMKNPIVEAKFLDTKTRYAPFLLGMLVARLSEKENRLSLSNADLLSRIHRRFFTHFGFNMGRFSIEPKLERQRNKVDIPVIKVQRTGEVISALIGVPSVSSLPFLPNIARLRAAA